LNLKPLRRVYAGAIRLNLTFVCEMVDLTTRASIANLLIGLQFRS
jgi:hypothetical protein